MLKGILVMARFTFQEAMRKKVLIAGIILTGVYLFLFGLGLHLIRGQVHAMDMMTGMTLFSMGLYLAAFLTVLVAAFTGVAAISGEIESGTAYALLTKPVSRAQILLGKFLGAALMLGLYAALFFFALWGLLVWQCDIVLPGVVGMLPVFMLQAFVMLGLSFLGSTLFSTLANGITLFLLYGVALVGGMIEQIGALAGQFGGQNTSALVNIGIATSLLLPCDALYRRIVFVLVQSNSGLDFMGALTGGLGPLGAASVPSAWMVVYAAAYLFVCLALATYFFSRRDI